MERIRKPLEAMGARLTLTDGHAPLTIHGGPLQRHRLHHARPQRPGQNLRSASPVCKPPGQQPCAKPSAPATTANWPCAPSEPTLTRDLDSVSITGPQPLHAIEAAVPGDISSAAFFLCAAALFPGSSLVLDSLGLNPTRATLLDVLTALGAHIAVLNLEEKHAELVGTVQITAPAEGLGSARSQRRARRAAHRRAARPRRHRALHQRRHPHPRRERAARERIRPHRPGGEESARHGR